MHSSSKNNNENIKKNQNIKKTKNGDSLEAIPSNQYEIDPDDDSLLSSLHLDAVPVDSSLVASSEADFSAAADSEIYISEEANHSLLTSQYLELPEDFKKEVISKHKQELAEEKEIGQDTIACDIENEEEDSVAEINIEKQNEEKVNTTSNIFPYLQSKSKSTKSSNFVQSSDSSLLEAEPIGDSYQDMIHNMSDQTISEDSVLEAQTVSDDSILEAQTVSDDSILEAQTVSDDSIDSKEYIAEAVGEETFLSETKDMAKTEDMNEEIFSRIKDMMSYATEDISARNIPILNNDNQDTQDFAVGTEDISARNIPSIRESNQDTQNLPLNSLASQSQNMPTQDIPINEVPVTSNLTATEKPGANIPFTSPFKEGDVIDNRYKILGFLGQGGMAYVYKVEHLLLPGNKYFALKVLGGFHNKQQEFSKRFNREVGVMMEFSHPHVIAIRDFGMMDKYPYFTMDFCPGTPIKDVISQQGALDIKTTLKVATQVLSALEEAHKKHIIHRDLKPENLMLEYRNNEPHVYVLDFGIAKNLNIEYTEKLTQGIIGTLLYMSPEQATAQNLTIGTDIYSLGATLYHMITGRAPFTGTKQEVLIKIVQENPLPPSYVRRGIPEQIDKLILKALAKKTDERYESAQEFLEAINSILQDSSLDKIKENSLGTINAQQAFTPGDVVNNKYRIVDVLGSGGMGIVYKVEHLELSSSKRFFALKLLEPHLSKDPTFKDRFYREIEMAMEFSHEHVIQIRDFGHTSAGHYYYTMDYSRGQTLTNVICKNTKLPTTRALNITKQVLSALKNPHKKNIAHRDLKPDNIIIEDRNGEDHALVLDFGIAKILDNSNNQKITQEGSMGTPYYMSPEQAGAEELDVKTDFYSIGIILFEMITGKVPFTGSTKEVLVAHVIKKPPIISQVIANVSLAVEELISKSLQKDRSARFNTAEEFINAIDNIEAREKKLIQRRKWKKVFRLLAASLILAGFGSIAFLFLFLNQKNHEIEQRFQAALKNNDAQKAQAYIQEIKEQFFSVNTVVFSEKLEQLNLQMLYYQAVQEYKISEAEKLFYQIEKMSCSKPLTLIQLQSDLGNLYRKKYAIDKIVADINQLRIDEAKQELEKDVWKKDVNTQILLQLITFYETLKSKTQNNIAEAKTIISRDMLPLLKTITIFNLRNFEISIRKIEQQLNGSGGHQNNQNTSQNMDNDSLKLLISKFESALKEGKIGVAENLIGELQNYPESMISYNKKQVYSKKYDAEKEYARLKNEGQVEAYKSFLQRNPGTPHKKQIQEIIAKDLEKQYFEALAYYKDMRYEVAQVELQKIYDNSYRNIMDKKVNISLQLNLIRTYNINEQWSKIIKLEKNFTSQLSDSEKYEAMIYTGIAYQKTTQNKKAYGLMIKIYSHLLSLKSQNFSDNVKYKKKYYKEAFKILIDNIEKDSKRRKTSLKVALMKKALSLFPEESQYARSLGILYSKKDKNLANEYITKYLKGIQETTKGEIDKLPKEDKKIVDLWFSLQSYYPLKRGYVWEYQNLNSESRRMTHQIIEITEKLSQTKYKITDRDVEQQNSFSTKDIYIKEGYIYETFLNFKGNQVTNLIMPSKIKTDSRWKRDDLKESVSVIGYRIAVSYESEEKDKEVMCLKLKATNPYGVTTYEYYAPNKGLIKIEKNLNGKTTFEKILKKFETK